MSELPKDRDASRRRGGASTSHGFNYRASEHFDIADALRRLRATLAALYDDEES